MNQAMKYHAASLLLLLLASNASADDSSGIISTEHLEIQLAGNNKRERDIAEALSALAQGYDLSSWIFSSQVRIESGAIPHSHPVLTLNTRHIANPDQLLAVFLHEQIHRYLAAPENEDRLASALSDLRKIYAEVPHKSNGGAANEESTYLHLLVNWLEFDALRALLGVSDAEQVLRDKDVYEWIYRRILEDGPRLESIVIEHDLGITHSSR